jgi:hypothetical protein
MESPISGEVGRTLAIGNPFCRFVKQSSKGNSHLDLAGRTPRYNDNVDSGSNSVFLCLEAIHEGPLDPDVVLDEKDHRKRRNEGCYTCHNDLGGGFRDVGGQSVWEVKDPVPEGLRTEQDDVIEPMSSRSYCRVYRWYRYRPCLLSGRDVEEDEVMI